MILCCVAAGVALSLAALFAGPPPDPETLQTGGVAADSFVEAPIDIELAEPGSRPNYRYSVIPGGAYTAHDLARAIHRDAVNHGE
jgi:hypothetical protein